MKSINIIGKKFNRLFVLKKHTTKKYFNKNGKLYCTKEIYKCLCDCGNFALVSKEKLLSGHTQSCGCYHIDVCKKLKTNKKHGMHKTRIYRIWAQMLNRTKWKCKKEVVKKNYWGRGITVCKEWEDFENFKNWSFLNGYNDNLTLDRIDNNGNYEPSNCRWATNKQQMNNRRNTIMVRFEGKDLPMSEVVGLLNRSESFIHNHFETYKKYV